MSRPPDTGDAPPPGGAPVRPTEPGGGYFQAVGIDFDGTLTAGGVPDAEVLAALADARRRGLRLVLVTGRILSELREVWPEVDSHFDLVVAENGAVLAIPEPGAESTSCLVAVPVDALLRDALLERGVEFRSGEVILAAAGADEAIVLDALRQLGLDSQLVRNRSELMVVPAGVSKGTGLFEALGELGVSHHNAIGVGDAENDHSLLQVCEVGVAVENAVDSLKQHADLVLEEPDGRGVAGLLRSDLVAGTATGPPGHWRLTLGSDPEGRPVEVPGSRIDVLITGASGAGKSYVAGLIAEQLLVHGYSLLVIDPEGDHVGLAQRRGVFLVAPFEGGPPPEEVAQLFGHRFASVVLDLSGMARSARASYLTAVASEVQAQRVVTGIPQWIIVDEAQSALGDNLDAGITFDPSRKGRCLVTWRPTQLPASLLAEVDAVIVVAGADPQALDLEVAAAVGDVSPVDLLAVLEPGPGRAVLTRRDQPGRVGVFELAARRTDHFRHDHKYGRGGLEPAHRFYFRTVDDFLTGASAGSIQELECELSRCDPAVLRHHCPGGDFSRWILDVMHDEMLAAAVSRAEDHVTATSPPKVVDETRLEILGVLRARWRGAGPGRTTRGGGPALDAR